MKTLISKKDTTTHRIKISIHPKLAAFLDLLVGAGLLWFFNGLISSWWMVMVWGVVRMVWWVIIMRGVYYAQIIRRIDHIRSLLIFHIGICAIMLFVDWSVGWYVWGTFFALGPALSFWFLPTSASELSFVAKPHVRWCLMLTVVGIAGVWSSAAAMTVFYSFWYWVVGWLVALGWTLLVSIIWWRRYDAPHGLALRLWVLLVGIVMAEISAVMLLWPTGFLITGLLIAWIWYMIWQLGRFYFSTDGINWKKQRSFLIINALLLLGLTIELARWK